MTELDRVALRHAYLLLRQNNPGASRVLDTGGAVSWRLWVEVLRATYGDDEERVEPRMLRARLALAIRALLRVDAEGRDEWCTWWYLPTGGTREEASVFAWYESAAHLADAFGGQVQRVAPLWEQASWTPEQRAARRAERWR